MGGETSTVNWSAQISPFNTAGDNATYRFFKYVGREGAMSSGTLTYVPSTGKLMMPSMDNVFNNGTSGYAYLDPLTGNRTGDTRLFGDFTANGFSNVNFLKANNWGGAEVICSLPPIQIGNYVWIDSDLDGVQDPCEDVVPDGLPVSLYNNDTGMWEDVTTTLNGTYYFNDVDPNTNYSIVFGYDHTNGIGSWNPTTMEFTINSAAYELTTPNATTSTNGPDANDLNDSDATIGNVASVLTGYPVIAYTTGTETNHTLDLGLAPPCVPPTANAGGDQTVCGVTAVNITATANAAGTWSGGAGTFADATMASTTYTPDASEVGTTVTLTWTTVAVAPCVDAIDMMNITINTPATANAGADQTVCGNAPVSIAATANGAGMDGRHGHVCQCQYGQHDLHAYDG
ncbi:MAG: SdrD B-like domain-containing protein [Saprospiraceae bacterium]